MYIGDAMKTHHSTRSIVMCVIAHGEGESTKTGAQRLDQLCIVTNLLPGFIGKALIEQVKSQLVTMHSSTILLQFW